MAEQKRMQFERRMSDGEALMWHLEKDPELRASFGSLTFLDRPPDPARFRDRMDQAVRVIPRLRQRVISPPLRLMPPEWAEDPAFDLDFHVRRIAVPAPGSDRQVLDLAARLNEDAFDRARPLWQFTLIEGLEGGRGAIFQKLHHTITDGEGGLRLSAMFVDLERDATQPMAGPIDDTALPTESSDAAHPLDVARATLAGTLRRPVRLAAGVASGAAGALRHPDRIPRQAGQVVEGVRSLGRQLAVTEPARSPLWTQRSLARRFEILGLSLDDVKTASKALGGTVNDFFVAGAAGAAGAYHRKLGVDVDDLRMAMPVSTRTKGNTGGNAFSPTRTLVPAGVADPAERFAEVHRRMQSTRSEPAIGMAEAMAGVIVALPTSVLVRFALQQVHTVDFATSNLRGAPFDLYTGGALIEANYPMGPTGGTAFNLTTMSYRGRLDMGLHIDTAAVAEPELLLSCLEESYAELLAAAG
jgi:diacylglycerol O-acyltransferase / wax synthase